MINVITKQGSGRLHGSALGEIGSGKLGRGSASVGGSFAQGDYFLTTTYQSRRGFPLSDDFASTSTENGGLRDNSGRRRINVYANIGYRPVERLQLGLSLTALEGEYGIPPSTINNRNDLFADPLRFERVQDQLGYSAQLSAEIDTRSPWILRGWTYFNRLGQDENRYDSNLYNSIADPTVRGTFLTSSETTIAGLHLQSGYKFARFGTLSVAFDGRANSMFLQKVVPHLVNLGR